MSSTSTSTSAAAEAGVRRALALADAGRAASIVIVTAVAFKALSQVAAEFAEAWGASYLFPPAAVSLAAGAAWGVWGLLGVVAGVFLAPWGAATTPATLALFSAVNGLTAAIPAFALRAPRGTTAERLKRLVLYGLVLNNLASAVAGTLALTGLGHLPATWPAALGNLFTWWIGDAVACLVLGLPLLLALAPAVVLDDDFRRLLVAWGADTRKLLGVALLLLASVLALVGLQRLGWSYREWATLPLVAPIALAALHGGLGAAIWAQFGVSLVYFVLSVLPSLLESAGPPREVLAPAYTVLVFFAGFSVVGGYLSGRNRQLLDRVRRQQSQLERDFERTVRSLAAAIEAKDASTVGHVQRVSDLALRVGEEMGLPAPALAHLRYAALLHDVGKIGVPETVLNKPGPLDPPEHELMQQHVEIGLRILGSIEVLRDVLPLVQYHQERWDGRREGVRHPGYFGLSGERIPLGARILAAVDAFDAMTNDRPYRRGRPLDEALEELEREAGSQFDPAVAATLTRLVRAEGPRPRARRSNSDSGILISSLSSAGSAGSSGDRARP